jgi:Carboxypeptidase regulatory-like domain
MKVRFLSLLCIVLTTAAIAQEPAVSKEAEELGLQGIVVKASGEPLKKATVEVIAEDQKEGANYTATTDADGRFQVKEVKPGRYNLFVERTSFIAVDKNNHRSLGTALTVTAGQPIKDLLVRMVPAAVVRGRVVDEDGDPMPNVEVSASRKTYTGGKQQWGTDGSDHTNDLGEYRIGGLLPGQYFVTATPPPTFLSMVASPKDATQGPDKPETGYVTTYYPGTTDRRQAAALVLHAGDEMPVDFSLVPARTFHIRGMVANVQTGANVTVILHSREAGPISSAVEVSKDGRFELRGVSSGVYSVVATVDQGETVQMAHQAVRVAASDVEGLRLVPVSGTTVKGRIRAETSAPIDFGQVFVSIQPLGGEDGMLDDFSWQANANTLGRPKSDGTFEWKDVAMGTYNFQVACDSQRMRNCFLKSVLVDGKAASDASLRLNGGTISVELVLSDHAGEVEGTVVSEKNEPVPDIQVVAVPETKYRKITDRYQKVISDQHGHFVMRAVVPGAYTLFAWDDLDGEPYYDAEFLKAHESEGQSLRVQEGSRENVVIKAGSAASDPQ